MSAKVDEKMSLRACEGGTRGVEGATPARAQSPESAGDWRKIWLPPQLIKAILKLIKATNAKAVRIGRPTRTVGGYELSIWLWWTGDVKKVVDTLDRVDDIKDESVHIKFVSRDFDCYNDELIHVIADVYFFDDMWKLFFDTLQNLKEEW
jgi:hypothetical protein